MSINKLLHPSPGAFFVSILTILASILFWESTAFPLNSHNIKGLVLDADTGEPIAGAEVTLTNTSRSFITDYNGSFLIMELPAGKFTIEIKADAYQKAIQAITVIDGPDLELVFRMIPIIFIMPGKEVRAYSPRHSIKTGTLIGSVKLTAQEAALYRDVGEIVEKFPGVFIRESGPGGEKNISINGCDPGRVNVVFDGILLNPGSGKSVDLKEIPLISIGKIELYTGKGGIGGIIIMTSRTFSDTLNNKAYIDETMESFKTNNIKAGLEFPVKQTGISLFAELHQTKGDFSFTNRFGERQSRINNRRESQNYFGKIKLSVIGDTEVSFQYYRSEKGSPGPLLQTDSTAHISRKKLLTSIRHYRSLSPRISLKFRSNGLLLKDRYISTDGFVEYDLETDESRYTSSVAVSYAGQLGLEAGIDYEYEDFQTRDIKSVSNNIGLKIRRKLKIRGAVTYEKLLSSGIFPLRIGADLGGNACFTSRYAPFHAYNWGAEAVVTKRIITSFSLFGSTSYKLPDYYSLFFKEDIYAVGNPDLKPEQGSQLGWRMNISWPYRFPISAGFTHTENHIDNIIIWKQRFDGKYAPDNLEKAVLKTTSFSMAVGSSELPFLLKFQHSRYRPINKNEFRLHRDKYLLFRPLYSAMLTMALGTADIRMEINHRWVGKRYIRMENTLWLDPYQITSLVIKYKLNIAKIIINLRAGIDNLGDEPYEIIERYPSPGRSYNLGINLSF